MSCPAIGAGDVALTPDGDLVAAWTRRDAAGNYHVEAATRPAGGTFSAPRELGLAATEPDPTDTNIKRPAPVAVELDGNGAPVIAWLAQVSGKRLAQASIGLAPGVSISTPGIDASDLKLAMNAAGEAVAVWTRAPAIMQAAIRPPGGAFATPQDLSGAGNAVQPDVAIDPRGAVLAVWADGGVGPRRIQFAARAPRGAFGPALNLSTVGTEARQPDVAFDALGRATFIWQRGTVIQAVARSSGGAFGATEDVGASNAAFARAQLAVNAENTAVAAWVNQAHVQSAARPNGASFDTPRDISAPGVPVDPSVRVAIDAAGNARAAWVGFNGIVESARRPVGGEFGGVDQLGPGANPRVALDELGNAATEFAAGTAQLAAFDGAPPVIRDLSVTPTVQSSTVFDVWSPVTVSWDFGDGATAVGETTAHAFAPGAFTVTARATDQFGREAVATRPLTVAVPPLVAAPPPVVAAPPVLKPAPVGRRSLNNLVGNNWDVLKKKFTLTLLVVRAPIPAGAVAEVRCSGKSCPFKTKRSSKVRKGEINLLALLSKKARKGLRAGQTVEVRLTAPGVSGRAVKFALKAGKVPKPVGRSL